MFLFIKSSLLYLIIGILLIHWILFANNLNSLRISSLIEEISYINIAFLNILIIHLKDYEINLNAIKIIIHDNQIEVCQVNFDIFNQLIK